MRSLIAAIVISLAVLSNRNMQTCADEPDKGKEPVVVAAWEHRVNGSH